MAMTSAPEKRRPGAARRADPARREPGKADQHRRRGMNTMPTWASSILEVSVTTRMLAVALADAAADHDAVRRRHVRLGELSDLCALDNTRRARSVAPRPRILSAVVDRDDVAAGARRPRFAAPTDIGAAWYRAASPVRMAVSASTICWFSELMALGTVRRDQANASLDFVRTSSESSLTPLTSQSPVQPE